MGNLMAQWLNRPGQLPKKTRQMGQVHWDVVTCTVSSFEGYKYSVIYVDSATRFQWSYGLKKKSEIPIVNERWWADRADVRQRHQLITVMRDCAAENHSAKIDKFYRESGWRRVLSYFSTPYQQYQNTYAESSILVVARLVRTELISTVVLWRDGFVHR